MAGHGLGGVHDDVIGMLTEDFLDRLGLILIIEAGGGAVCIDVVDIFRRNTCIRDGILHAASCEFTTRTRSCNMVSIAIRTIADDLCINVRASLLCVFKFFKDEDTTAFTEYETVTTDIKGAGCFFRRAFTGRERMHSSKTSHRCLCDSRFGTAGKHHIRIAPLDHAGRSAKGIVAGSAGGDVGQDRSLQAEGDGDHTGGHVGDHHRDCEWIHFSRTAFFDAFHGIFHGLDPADTGTDDGADAVRIFYAHVELRILDRHFCCRNSKLSISIHVTDGLLVTHRICPTKGHSKMHRRRYRRGKPHPCQSLLLFFFP